MDREKYFNLMLKIGDLKRRLWFVYTLCYYAQIKRKFILEHLSESSVTVDGYLIFPVCIYRHCFDPCYWTPKLCLTPPCVSLIIFLHGQPNSQQMCHMEFAHMTHSTWHIRGWKWGGGVKFDYMIWIKYRKNLNIYYTLNHKVWIFSITCWNN